MFIVLIRHGNTFDEGQTPFYVGRTDVPLSQSGGQQAAEIAGAFERAGIIPACIYTSMLKRTQQTMMPMVAKLELTNVKADARLNELDYGTWEGKTNAEVDAIYGGSDKPRRAWDKQRIRPADAGFKPAEAALQKNLEDMIEEILSNYDDDKIVVICSSNGVLGDFAKLVPGVYGKLQEAGKLKVGTGNMCGIDFYKDPAKRKVFFWNMKAAEAPLEDF